LHKVIPRLRASFSIYWSTLSVDYVAIASHFLVLLLFCAKIQNVLLLFIVFEWVSEYPWPFQVGLFLVYMTYSYHSLAIFVSYFRTRELEVFMARRNFMCNWKDTGPIHMDISEEVFIKNILCFDIWEHLFSDWFIWFVLVKPPKPCTIFLSFL